MKALTAEQFASMDIAQVADHFLKQAEQQEVKTAADDSVAESDNTAIGDDISDDDFVGVLRKLAQAEEKSEKKKPAEEEESVEEVASEEPSDDIDPEQVEKVAEALVTYEAVHEALHGRGQEKISESRWGSMAKYIGTVGGGAAVGGVAGHEIGKRRERKNDPMIYRRGAIDGMRHLAGQIAQRNRAATIYKDMNGGAK